VAVRGGEPVTALCVPDSNGVTAVGAMFGWQLDGRRPHTLWSVREPVTALGVPLIQDYETHAVLTDSGA